MTQHINLLVSRQNDTAFAKAVMAGMGVLLLVLLGFWGGRQQEIARLEEVTASSSQQLDVAREQLKSRVQSGDNASPEEVAAELTTLKAKADAAKKILALANDMGSQKGYARQFHLLASVTEEGVWLTGVTVGQAGKSVSLHGQALRKDSVMRYAQRLNAAFAEDGVQLTSIELVPVTLPVAIEKSNGPGAFPDAVKFHLF